MPRYAPARGVPAWTRPVGVVGTFVSRYLQGSIPETRSAGSPTHYHHPPPVANMHREDLKRSHGDWLRAHTGPGSSRPRRLVILLPHRSRRGPCVMARSIAPTNNSICTQSEHTGRTLVMLLGEIIFPRPMVRRCVPGEARQFTALRSTAAGTPVSHIRAANNSTTAPPDAWTRAPACARIVSGHCAHEAARSDSTSCGPDNPCKERQALGTWDVDSAISAHQPNYARTDGRLCVVAVWSSEKLPLPTRHFVKHVLCPLNVVHRGTPC